MYNSKNTSTTSSTEDILLHLNLNSIVGNPKAKTSLQCLTSSYYEEKIAGKNPIFPRILLLGNSTKSYAHAIHNTLGNLKFTELSADFTNKGGDDITDILRTSNEFDTIYISEAHNLSVYVQNILYKYLTCGEVEVVIDVIERKKEIVKVADVCLILGATTLQGLSRSLYKQFTHIYLNPYTKYELVEVLKQRCEWYGIGYTSEQVLEKIAEEASGRAGKAVRLLELARKFMVVSGKERISLVHVGQVLTNWGFSGSNNSVDQ